MGRFDYMGEPEELTDAEIIRDCLDILKRILHEMQNRKETVERIYADEFLESLEEITK